MEIQAYLKPTFYLDFNIQEVEDLAKSNCNAKDTDMQKAIDLYYFVRDRYAYNPYHLDLRKEALKVSNLIDKPYGYCIEKSIILAALGRAVGIPTRLTFSDVRNHLGTSKLEQYLGTDVLAFHGSTEFFLNKKWVKCTPAFNKSLCEKLNVAPLDFDGINDSLFQECDKNGSNFMEYIHEYGTFSDMPMQLFVDTLAKNYPILWEKGIPKELGVFIAA